MIRNKESESRKHGVEARGSFEVVVLSLNRSETFRARSFLRRASPSIPRYIQIPSVPPNIPPTCPPVVVAKGTLPF